MKLAYNCVPTDGDCTGTTNNIGEIKFNSSYPSVIRVGYMYGLTAYGETELSRYETHLSDTSLVSSTNTDTETIGTKTFNIAGRHSQNAKSSTIKIAIDTWYQENIEGTVYEDMVEDTVWCNDRGISTIRPIGFSSSFFWYAATDRLYNFDNTMQPSLVCARDMDKFTVNLSNGNGDLEYPIGLLTADEVVLAGSRNKDIDLDGTLTYLIEESSSSATGFWTMSPRGFTQPYSSDSSVTSWVFSVGFYGIHENNVHLLRSSFVRPSISLKSEIKIGDVGDGSLSNPYTIVAE